MAAVPDDLNPQSSKTVATTTTEAPYIADNLSDTDRSLNGSGKKRILCIMAEFPNLKYSDKMKPGDVEKLINSKENTNSENYPFESISAYFSRASKGKFTISGKVINYTAKYKISHYKYGFELAAEALNAISKSYDLSEFDSDSDGVIDAVILSVPQNAPSSKWWPQSAAYSGAFQNDSLRTGYIVTGNADPKNPATFVSKYTHELCHCMGLADYYVPRTDGDLDGLTGSGGNELMDLDTYSDLSAFSKLMLGWYKKDQVVTYNPKLKGRRIRLENAQSQKGNVVKINSQIENEYFLIEYQTLEKNNSGLKKIFPGMYKSGVRIYHIRDEKSYGGFKYSENSADTDSKRFRLISYVNPENGAYQVGDIIDSSTCSGFKWYNKTGSPTTSPNLQIQICKDNYGIYIIIK